MRSENCRNNLHKYCHLCECPCHNRCECVIVNRKEEESQRDWIKRCMCMHHWMQTEYYQRKLGNELA